MASGLAIGLGRDAIPLATLPDHPGVKWGSAATAADVLTLLGARVQDVAIAFEEKVVEQLFLKVRRRGILHYLEKIFSRDTPGMDEHDEVEEINGVGGELFNVHVRPHQVNGARLKLVLLLDQSKRFGHSPVRNLVRQQVPVVGHTLHQNECVARE